MSKIVFSFFISLWLVNAFAQRVDTSWWHGKERSIRYRPQGNDFVIENGNRRFVRALYGTNTAFRVEAGDLPEFALYMPGMGGNFKFGIITGGSSKWLIDAKYIKAIYRPGSMIYEIRDELLGKGTMNIIVLALADAEGMVIRTAFKNVPANVELVWAFGGASGKRFTRDGDVGADPESSFYLHPENCRDNIFTINHNAFSLSYGSGKVLTEEERYEIQHLPDNNQRSRDAAGNSKNISGLFPVGGTVKIGDALKQRSPFELFHSKGGVTPVLTGKLRVTTGENFFLIQSGSAVRNEYGQLRSVFEQAERSRKKLAERVRVNTPDKYINTIGGALGVAADAIWEDPSYLHGAVAWRMRLNAWRGAYVADPLGWHDRARKHFSSYALSQITSPPTTGVVMDTALHLARHQEKVGTALFSDGYICRNPNGDIRAHHYDMNLVFVDQLLNHFNWTGDTGYVKEMWPLIKRHLAWEKRNFDADDDGLYDAYAAIWASDALQYSGGGVTHSSAYNFRANKTAAALASLAGEDGTTYRQEADKILQAVKKNLWLPEAGHYAEYKDLLGNQLVHPAAGLWTIYHAIDSKLPDAFEAYQCLRYIDEKIPRIPVKAKGLNERGLYLLSTTNWQPYTWSINNVALAEILHTSLAYWQANRGEQAFHLWRSAVIESMYLGASPGGFQQLSFYDAIRGELYRDFADPVGMAGRTLVEGLFGVQPDALNDTLTIRPGYPLEWKFASLELPDLHFDFKRNADSDTYTIRQNFPRPLSLKLILPAIKDNIEKVTVNGRPLRYVMVSETVVKPMLMLEIPFAEHYVIHITWKGKQITKPKDAYPARYKDRFTVSVPGAQILEMHDPSSALTDARFGGNSLSANLNISGSPTFFLKLRQGQFEWWQPIHVQLRVDDRKDVRSDIVSSRAYTIKGQPQKIDLSLLFNDKVTNIFKHEYLSPRPKSPTLQLPTQGIGNWCYPLVNANIDDRGLRSLVKGSGELHYKDDVYFASPADTSLNNVVFTSQWDNFPDSISIPLSGSASGIYFLLAGSTNPMQSQLTNGKLVVAYEDGTVATMDLRNPDNWWPIEQDYLIDGDAFNLSGEQPDRLYLKEGRFAKSLPAYSTIRGFSNRAIDGGAATVLSMRLDEGKRLRSLTIHAVANDVVIGLMAATLVR